MAKQTDTIEIEELIKKQINLPSPPAIAVKILNVVQEAEFSLKDLERILSADPALVSKLLRVANSAVYSLPNKIGNINRALSILGTNLVKNIALSFIIAEELRGRAGSTFDFDYFWRRSVTAAVAAELVMGMTNKKDANIFVTGLLQDVGVLVLHLTKGKEYDDVLKNCIISSDVRINTSEQQHFRYDHQQVGSMLLHNWGLPESVTAPTRFHHEPEHAPSDFRQTALVLQIANMLSAICNGRASTALLLEIKEKLATSLNIDPERSHELLDDVARKSIDILEIFEVDPGKIKPYSLILQEANEELGRLNFSYEQLLLALKEEKSKSERFAEELRLANAKLEQIAFRDGLTNLHNHRSFQDILQREMARTKRYGHPLSLVLFDIDYFKDVNDTHGHPAGDQVLINLANTISSAVRPNDIVARYGGEEFAVILPETDRIGMRIFAERLRHCVATITTVTNSGSIQITISCGGIQYAQGDTLTQQELLEAADRGLYLSKRNGRNRVTIITIDKKGQETAS
ncbi:MAG: GGDEF domain-containing protein [Desulforhopalus sp.]|nr:GGDEF domain-containing protein [Desulforhopalus sp.]